MAKPNYSYEKRKRALEKMRKKELRASKKKAEREETPVPEKTDPVGED